MRLGAMLLRDGRLTSGQVDAAMAQQARVGGRLGTVLLEMGLIDADALTNYLGLDQGIPIASRGALERAKRSAVRLLTPALARRFVCVPLVAQDRQLVVAMHDPHDMLALDELALATGYRIIPRVAPEARLLYYLERYYGVPMAPRYRALSSRVASSVPKGGRVAPPLPLPGLPPEIRHTAPADGPPHSGLEDAQADDDLDIVLEDGIDDLSAPDPPPPPPVAVRSLPPAPPRPADETLDRHAAAQRMAEATTRSAVADAMMAHARRLFQVGALLVVRNDLATGWKGFGAGLDADRVETLLVPLDMASVFHTAVESGQPWEGAVEATVLHGHVAKVLRAAPPRQAVVVPIAIKGRVVNLLYGQRDAPLTRDELDDLREVARAASEAYVRLIAMAKKGS